MKQTGEIVLPNLFPKLEPILYNVFIIINIKKECNVGMGLSHRPSYSGS
jgi:hypothetical protein